MELLNQTTSELIELGDQKGSTSNVLRGQETFFHQKKIDRFVKGWGLRQTIVLITNSNYSGFGKIYAQKSVDTVSDSQNIESTVIYFVHTERTTENTSFVQS